MAYQWKTTNGDKSVFGQRLNLARVNAGLSWNELARRSGWCIHTLADYTRESCSNASPRVVMVETLAEVLKVNPAWLVGWSENAESVD